MKKLQISKIKGYEYELKDSENNTYEIMMEFYDLNKELKINDYIYMAEELLNPNYKEYNNFYRFGKLNSIYGRKIKSAEDIDIIVVQINEELIHFQRYYG